MGRRLGRGRAAQARSDPRRAGPAGGTEHGHRGGWPSPDVTIVAGGAFAVAPPRAVALAIADTIRRPGRRSWAVDHARLLGPIGTIDDPDERRDLVADLADDLLAPIGSLLIVGSVPRRAGGGGARGSPDPRWRSARAPRPRGRRGRVRRSRARRPGDGDPRVPGRGPGRPPGAARCRAGGRVAWLASPSTCGTCRCGCRSGATGGGRRWPRGASSRGRATSDDGRRRRAARTSPSPIVPGLALVEHRVLVVVTGRRVVPAPARETGRS